MVYSITGLVPTSGGFFHDLFGGDCSAGCATFSNGNDNSDPEIRHSSNNTEPEEEGNTMNDPDGHEAAEQGESEVDNTEDECQDPAPFSAVEWVVYRPNRYAIQRRDYCLVQMVGPDATTMRDALPRCWDLRGVDLNSLRLYRVHDPVLTSSSAMGKYRVYIAEYAGDGRDLLHHGERLILLEVLIVYNGNWIVRTTRAHYLIWRGSPEAMLHNLIEAQHCYGDHPDCYFFQNGLFRPWRAITTLMEGDFIQLQIGVDEQPPQDIGTPAFSSAKQGTSVGGEYESLGIDHGPFFRNVAFRASFVDRPALPSLEYVTPGQQYAIPFDLFQRYWHDLVGKDWFVIDVNPSARLSSSLAHFDNIHLINHEDERRNGDALILFEQLYAGSSTIRGEWIICCASRDMLIAMLDRARLCDHSRSCELFLNGVLTTLTDTINLRHGDYLVLKIVDVSTVSVQIYNYHTFKSNGGSSFFGLAGLPVWFTIILLDAAVFLLLCAGMIFFDKPTPRRSVVAGGRRYSFRCRHSALWRRQFKGIMLACLAASADAGPILQHWTTMYQGGGPWFMDSNPPVFDDDFLSHDLVIKELPISHNERPTDEPLPDPPDLAIYPLPAHPRDVQGTRRPRARLWNDGIDLQSLLGDAEEGQDVVLETYGLYDGPVGARSNRVQTLDRDVVVRTIHQLWIDYTAHFDSDIILVQPQPTRSLQDHKVVFVVHFIDHALNLPDSWRPVLVDQMMTLPTGVGAMTTRAAAFLDHPCSVTDVFQVVRVANSCPPNGIRPCTVRWNFRSWLYTDRIHPRSGDFIVVNIETLQQYFVGTEDYFAGARRFALDGHRTLTQIDGDEVPLWIHAISNENEPLGFRVSWITMSELLQPERIWLRARELWRDKLPGRNSILVAVQPQPNDSIYAHRLHLILAFSRIRDHFPVLFLTKVRSDSDASGSQNFQWRAKYCAGRISDLGLLQCVGIYSFLSATGSDFAVLRANRRLAPDEHVMLRPGDHVVVVAYLPSFVQALRQLWEAYSEIAPPEDDTMNLLQVGPISISRKGDYVWPTFDSLPPPGNGAIVDLRRDFECLDDYSQHDWGVLLFDVLERGVDKPSGPLSSVQVDLPDLTQLFENLLSAPVDSFPQDLLKDNLEAFDEDLRDRIQGLACEKCIDPECIQVYTDGSYDPTTDSPVGWGFVAITCGPHGYVLEHLACGYIDDFCPILHGHPVSPTARTGEVEALLQATIWTICSMLCIPFSVYYDAITVGHSAMGRWNHKPDDIHMRILRAVTQFAEHYHERGFSGEHIYSHSGFLGNEIANFLANYARQHRFECGKPMINLAPYTGGDRMPIEWLWLRLIPFTNKEEAFPHISGCALEAHCFRSASSTSMVFPSLLQPQQPMEEKTKTISFGLATYNVGSLLRPGTEGPDSMAPQEYLRQQATAHGITCLFLQETRARQSGLIESNTHIRIIAAASNGVGGTEIWIAKINDKRQKTGIKVKDVLVLYTTTQIVLVRVRWPFGRFLLLSAHSPHSGRSNDDIHEWWEQLSSLVAQHYNPADEWLLCGIDANAHFDTSSFPWIGDHGLERATNFPGECFLRFLETLDLCAPSTFENNHVGPTATWRTHLPKEAVRCDYVCVPVNWRPSQLTSKNIPTLDAGTSSFDHVPVALWCSLVFTSRRVLRHGFDKEAIEVAYREHGRHLVESLQTIPWTADVHEHGFLISEKTKCWLETYCPRPPSQPRSSYISADTWQLRKHRLWLARQFRVAMGMYQQQRLRLAFLAWQCDQPLSEILLNDFGHTQQLCHAIRLTRNLLKSTRNCLRRCLRKDRTAFLEKVADDAISDHPNALHKHLRRAGVQSRAKRTLLQPLPCLNDLDGKLVTSFADYAETWRKQFEIQEDGVPCTHEELYQRCLQRQVWNSAIDVPPDWTQLPTLTELEHVFRQTKTRKAFFDDMVPGEVLHHAAKEFAVFLYPLLLKQWLFHQEPLLFKGGLLVSAFKKGDATDPNNYRSLLISPTIAKAFHRLLRGDLMKQFSHVALPLQLGGRPGIGVTQASHVLHDFLHQHRQLKKPTAIVFLDIRNAFYRLFRQQLLKGGTLERSVDELFSSLGLPPQAREEFSALIQGKSAMEASGIAGFLQGQVRELLNATWFTVSGTPVLTEARKGSRPGDSTADLLFSIAFRHLPYMVSTKAADLGVVSHLEWSGEQVPYHDDLERTEVLEFLGPIWADDVAILLVASTAANLVRNTQIILGLLFDHLIIAGMSPNLGKSKTEILFDLRGPGSTPIRKHFAFNGYRLPTISKHMLSYVNIVGAYKHLGTWVQVNGKLNKELSCRFAIGHSTMTKYKSAIFANRHLPLSRKTHLFQSLVLTAVLFNSPAWYLQRKKDVEKFHSGIMSLYRRLATAHFGLLVRHWRDELVQARLSVPPPITLLHQDRLRYLQHLVRQGDDAVWAALQQHGYWWSMVDLSLTWLKNNVMKPLPELPVANNWTLWVPLLSAPGGAWKSLIRRAVIHDTLQTRKASSWFDFHTQFCQFFVDNEVHEFPSTVYEWNQFACLQCRQSFRTCAAWSVHAFRKHGRTTLSRMVARGDTCEICLKKFHDHMGLVNHLSNNPDCFWQLRTLRGNVEPQPSLNSRAEIKTRTELRTPVHRVMGPRPPRVEVADPTPTTDQQLLFDSWEAVRVGHADLDESAEVIREALRVATLDTILPIHEIHYVATSWQRLLRLQDVVQFGDHFDVALSSFIGHLDAKWLLQDQTLPRCSVDDPVAILTSWASERSSFTPVERPLRFRQVVVAHLFSGRRRIGDLQAHLESLPLPAGLSWMILSVDIIFNETWGNLLRPDTLQLFLRACKEGIVTALVAGPPCETWSIARLRGLYGDNGPRPLRDVDNLSGYNQLSVRETQQVCIGNELLGVAILLAAAMWTASGLMILEHPAEPARQPRAASIWRLMILRFLLSKRGVVRHRVYQGLYGAVSAKPTDLLLVSPPRNFGSLLESHQTRSTLPDGGSIGRDQKGRYRTAALKEYPSGFCRALAHLILEFVATRVKTGPLDDCPEDVMCRFQCLVGKLDHSVKEFGPDFNPAAFN